MTTPESNNETGYIYYPIEYRYRAFSNVLSFNSLPPNNWSVWIKSIDKSKFLDGMCADYDGKQQENFFDVISIGF